MNWYILIAVVIGLLAMTAVAVTNLGTAEKVKTGACKSCGNGCTAENNCGLSTCGAAQGKTCSCGK